MFNAAKHENGHAEIPVREDGGIGTLDPTVDESVSSPGRWSRVKGVVANMGESIKIEGKRSYFIPVALLSALTVIGGMVGGILFQAGQIVANQRVADIKVDEVVAEFRDGVKAIEDTRRDIDDLEEKVQGMQGVMSDFMNATIERQSKVEAEMAANNQALRDALKRQEAQHLLLKDYTEGRIDHLPYKGEGDT